MAISRRHGRGGARLVLVHGSMDRASSFEKLARRLTHHDVTLYDRRGYGDSVGAGVAETIEQHVDDLVTVVGSTPSIIVGHSLGGLVALAASQRSPQLVIGVLAYEAPVPWASWWPRDSAGGQAVFGHSDDPPLAAETFMRVMIGDRRWERLPTSTRAARRAEGLALLAEMRALRRDAAPYDASALTVPIVSVRGSLSRGHHREGAAWLAATVDSAELMEIDGAEHGAHLTHPDRFADLVEHLARRVHEPSSRFPRDSRS